MGPLVEPMESMVMSDNSLISIATIISPITWDSVGLFGLVVIIRTFLVFRLKRRSMANGRGSENRGKANKAIPTQPNDQANQPGEIALTKGLS
jgi:hypothetical protein